ncbi:HD domain-containing protein [Microseira wollei]|uniref:Metal dependent phosphohydrolase n=1 Tax=Microseira wollei NIES-4236 TaxID=2530354 RepID=A0AAV3XK21_9CYAN|nr:HD domain-containing protein [Microseira wollei]GET41938.1 metal dependent phosphohydrolase [Microseira wollei NIES-4236]
MNDISVTNLTSRFEAALIYATQLHAKQRRKVTGVPYIAHLLGVAALVLEDGGDEDEAISALLHDAVEDQGGAATRLEILHRFGEKVVEIVDGCTEPDASLFPNWKEHKLQYLAQLRCASPSVQRVMLADKLNNIRGMLINLRLKGEAIWSQFRGSKEDILWLQQAQLEVYRQVSRSWMVEELEKSVRELGGWRSEKVGL